MATITSSVTVVTGPLPNAQELDALVAELRCRFPRTNIDRYLDKLPSAAAGAFVAPGASLVGDVRLGADVSIWYGCVLRGDLEPVIIGDRSNVQDRSGPTRVVGNRRRVAACRRRDRRLIGATGP